MAQGSKLKVQGFISRIYSFRDSSSPRRIGISFRVPPVQPAEACRPDGGSTTINQEPETWKHLWRVGQVRLRRNRLPHLWQTFFLQMKCSDGKENS